MVPIQFQALLPHTEKPTPATKKVKAVAPQHARALDESEFPISTPAAPHIAVESAHAHPTAQGPIDEVIETLGESEGLGAFDAASLACALHIHLSSTASAPTISGPALDYFTYMVYREDRTNLGPYTKLLLMACLSIVHLPSATSQIISEFRFQGAPLRNFECMKKCLFRMKNINEFSRELLDLLFL